jgi:hypothetical protein
MSDLATTELLPLGAPRATRGCDRFGFDRFEEPTGPEAITSSVHTIGSVL